jgi:ribosomal-protein-alanine N-acetyltransferase
MLLSKDLMIEERKEMNFAIRSMEIVDSLSLSNIERNAFPTQRPPTPFKRDIHNKKTRYLVAYKLSNDTDPLEKDSPNQLERQGAFLKIFNRVTGRKPDDTDIDPSIIGYIGLFFQIDEAHITAVGVHSAYRGQGIGELLLISGLELAQLRGASEATLEVRVSNNIAQSLYHKYAFAEKGIRPKYYTDNNEDAMIMTTDDLQSQGYKDLLTSLIADHSSRHGSSQKDLGT